MEAFEKSELIDRYLKNELTREELALFEKQLQEEPALQREIELHRTAIQSVKIAEIRNVLRRTHQQINEADKVYPEELLDAFYHLKEPVLKSVNFMSISSDNVELKRAAKNNYSGYVRIAYEGELNPPFPVLDIAGKRLFPQVKIFPASGSKNFHYQLTHANSTAILHLYGSFNPVELTFIYHEQEGKPVFKLKVQTKEYLLQPNKLIRPLQESDKPL